MNETNDICQECGNPIIAGEGIRMTRDAWLCNMCCEQFRQASDIY